MRQARPETNAETLRIMAKLTMFEGANKFSDALDAGAKALDLNKELIAALQALTERVRDCATVRREGVTGAAFDVVLVSFGSNWTDVFNGAEAAIAKAEAQ